MPERQRGFNHLQYRQFCSIGKMLLRKRPGRRLQSRERRGGKMQARQRANKMMSGLS
jgi:hypothetical protein